MGKILMKPEPVVQLPIVGYEKSGSTKFKVVSNYSGDELNGNLNHAKSQYKESNKSEPIYIGIRGNNSECIGLTIADAEELIESLQSMVKIIKG